MPNLQTPDHALKLSRTIGHTEWVRSQRGNLLKKKRDSLEPRLECMVGILKLPTGSIRSYG